MLRLGIVILLSKTHVVELPSTEVGETVQGGRMIREEGETGKGIVLQVDTVLVDASREPRWWNTEGARELGDGQAAREVTRRGLRAGHQEPVREAHEPHRIGQPAQACG